MLNVRGFMFQFPAVATDFCKRLKQVLGPAQRPTPQVPEVKGTRHETNHVPPPLPTHFHVRVLHKHMGNFLYLLCRYCTYYVELMAHMCNIVDF